MAESRGDGSIAPRRSLSGPILPPPPAVQAEEAGKDDASSTESTSGSGSGSSSASKGSALKGLASKGLASTGLGSKGATSHKQDAKGQGSVSRETSVPPSPSATSAQRSEKRPVRRTRKAHLRLVQIDAWSVLKTSFLLSIAAGVVLVVAVAIIWAVLGAAGVFDSINSIVQQSVGSEEGAPFEIEQYVGASRVLGFTMLVAVLDVVLITAMATLGAFLYNLSAALLGGVEVTLAEDA